MIDTIPDKIPKEILKNIKKEHCDKVILFTLAIFGTHKIKEFVNDIGYETRIDEVLRR